VNEHALTAGLEVHQQLDTKKLFCACPCVIRDDPAEFVVERSLRASAGESGETDIAAQHEQKKQKRYQYHGYQDTTCLVELDEEPVSRLNPQALHVALQVAKMLQLTLIDEMHVMRKTVVDGSNTSGFQRTMLVGVQGHIEVEGQQIRIEQLCLEEDSAKIMQRGTSVDVYNLSRLGIPLLEITTGPDLHSPQQVKAVAAYIGMLLRSTEAVKRGLGTIRQDVNVSVPGGNRVEIKGAQDLENLGLLVDYEAQRQKALINLALIIPKQQYLVQDLTVAFKETQAKFIAKSIQEGQVALGVKLAGWKESLATELMPGVRLGKELAGYAKAQSFGGLIHSEEDHTKYPLTKEVSTIKQLLHCSDDDGWLLMIGEKSRLLTFYEHVLVPRLQQLSVGVPKEVRKAEIDGTNTYLRPMPGANRMYPETDVRPVSPDTAHVQLPELLTERAKRLAKQYGISSDLADQLARDGVAKYFEQWVSKYTNVNASVIANLLVSKEQEIKTRHNIIVDMITYGPVLLEKLHEGLIAVSSIEDILVKLAKQQVVDWDSYAPADETKVRATLQQLIADNPGASIGLLMGKAMRALENKVDGKQVQRLLGELMLNE
jgi:glutamyl-tRNA(Gln) amidotransferase subunit E